MALFLLYYILYYIKVSKFPHNIAYTYLIDIHNVNVNHTTEYTLS